MRLLAEAFQLGVDGIFNLVRSISWRTNDMHNSFGKMSVAD